MSVRVHICDGIQVKGDDRVVGNQLLTWCFYVRVGLQIRLQTSSENVPVVQSHEVRYHSDDHDLGCLAENSPDAMK